MAYDKIVDSTYLTGGLTEIADAIRRKGETTAALAFPSEMAAAIEAIKSGGDGPVLNAVLYVSYPVGAVCTVTNGSKTYTALDTSGAALFVVEPGTWTATAELNGDTASKSVTLAALERTELMLAFDLTLFPNSDITWTAKTNVSSATLQTKVDGLVFGVVSGSSSNSNYACFCSTPVDVTDYSSVTVHYKVSSPGPGSSPTLRYGFGPDANGDITTSGYFNKSHAMGNEDTISANISTLTGTKCFYVGWVKDSCKMTFYVDSVVLK